MYKFVIVLLAIVAAAFAAPDPKPGVLAAYTAPVVAPAVVTAQSSQVFARNYNGLVSPIVTAAPIFKSAPLVTAPVNAYYNPYFVAPLTYF